MYNYFSKVDEIYRYKSILLMLNQVSIFGYLFLNPYITCLTKFVLSIGSPIFKKKIL